MTEEFYTLAFTYFRDAEEQKVSSLKNFIEPQIFSNSKQNRCFVFYEVNFFLFF